MIQKIWILEDVLRNIEPFNTKEDIVHEIRNMLKEAEEELHKQEIKYVREILSNDELTSEEREEFEEILKDMLENDKELSGNGTDDQED